MGREFYNMCHTRGRTDTDSEDDCLDLIQMASSSSSNSEEEDPLPQPLRAVADCLHDEIVFQE